MKKPEPISAGPKGSRSLARPDCEEKELLVGDFKITPAEGAICSHPIHEFADGVFALKAAWRQTSP